MKDFTFTIFTPCYNGEKTIWRVFNSVLAQTYNKWEWIIVNDGSSDNSDRTIQELLNHIPIIQRSKITYISQENIGKHRTWNKVAQMANGDYFLPADCDDSFIPETLAYFNDMLNKEEHLDRLSGINVCCYNPETGKLVGTPYPQDGLLSDNIELHYRYHIQGKHWGCIRTDLIKKYQFPELKGHYYTESYLWFSFPRDGYKLRCYNKCLRAYFYQNESLVHASRYKWNYNIELMNLHFTCWELMNVSSIVRKYSFRGYLSLYKSIITHFFKAGLSFINR